MLGLVWLIPGSSWIRASGGQYSKESRGGAPGLVGLWVKVKPPWKRGLEALWS